MVRGGETTGSTATATCAMTAGVWHTGDLAAAWAAAPAPLQPQSVDSETGGVVVPQMTHLVRCLMCSSNF